MASCGSCGRPLKCRPCRNSDIRVKKWLDSMGLTVGVSCRVQGRGDWALIIKCGGVPTILFFDSHLSAAMAKAERDAVGCGGGGCRPVNHELARVRI